MHGTPAKLFGRLLALVGGVVFVVILVKVILAILKPIVPGAVMGFFAQGAQMIYGFLLPALPAVAALALLYGLWWLISGRR